MHPIQSHSIHMMIDDDVADEYAFLVSTNTCPEPDVQWDVLLGFYIKFLSFPPVSV